MKNSHAFTLIELLVVVLIIAILAAVALPQYQVAVTKSRFMQGVLLCNSVYKAEQVYRLANGTYTDQFADLDIDVTGIGTLNQAGNKVSTPDFNVYLGQIDSDPYCHVWGKNNFPSYYFYMRGRKDCRVEGDNPIQHKVCLSLGAKRNGETNEYRF